MNKQLQLDVDISCGGLQKQYRFHILGIPHTSSNDRYLSCAYTQKVVRLCAMLRRLGHHVIHYGCESSVVDCDEHVSVTSDADLAAYGEQAGMAQQFKFSVLDPAYRKFYINANFEIQKRKQPLDMLLCMWGAGHKQIADAHPDMIWIEPGIGYAGGHFAPYKVFESYAILHAYYGLNAVGTSGHAKWYDAVIPNYFDVDDFEYRHKKQDYFLFVGRLSAAKGLDHAIEFARAAGVRLVVAGTGQPDCEIPLTPASGSFSVEVVGFADKVKRRELMSCARALLAPSMFIEPFCGVHIEAMLSGTPVISTDWGVFTESNLHGITGYRCRTHSQFVWAIHNIHRIDPADCRRWALQNYSMQRVAKMYAEFFQMVMDVHGGKGWYEPHDERYELNWLSRRYPRI